MPSTTAPRSSRSWRSPPSSVVSPSPSPTRTRTSTGLATSALALHHSSSSSTLTVRAPHHLFRTPDGALTSFVAGSSDLWIPSWNCTDPSFSKKKKYDPKSSSTGTRTEKEFIIHYGDGSSVSGPVWIEVLQVASIIVRAQYFAPVHILSPTFASELADGILGLAFPSLSSIHAPPFVNSAKDQGAIKDSVFGFKIAKSSSELYIGGTDSSMYTGDLEYHDVVGNTGYWQIGGGELSIGPR